MDKYLYRKRSEWIVQKYNELWGCSRGDRFVAISKMCADQLYVSADAAMRLWIVRNERYRCGMYGELYGKIESIRRGGASAGIAEVIDRAIHQEASCLFLSVKRIEMLYNEAVRNGWG